MAMGQRVVIAKQLFELVLNWRCRAARYAFLSELETDALGRKFYSSTAIAYANCAAELENFIQAQVIALPVQLEVTL